MKDCNDKKLNKPFWERYNLKNIFELSILIVFVYMLMDMTNIISKLYEKYGVFIFLAFIIIILFVIVKNNLINLMNLNVINYVDFLLVSMIASTIIYIVVCKIFVYNKFKTIALVIFLIVLVICKIFRLYKLKSYKAEKETCNVYDLKEVYNNEIEDKEGNMIFLRESDVNYDLLNRDKTISELQNSIYFCKNEKCFVISLTGEWGVGKTTILNIVKSRLKNEKIIIIDDFNVWKYNNEKILLYEMFDMIMSKIGIKFSAIQTRNFVNTCINIVTSNSLEINSFTKLEKDSINEIKNTISDYLLANEKRVVIFIDNLERTNENNILTILKIISTILNLDRFIYVLSYDEDEMKSIFVDKLKINYDYIEKVVQLPLKVPEVDNRRLQEVCNICVKNLLVHYGIEEKNIEEYNDAIELFNESLKDLRSFKRKINSIFNNNFYNNNYLNVIDAFLIQLIQEENIELYNTIKNNYEYFISQDQIPVYGYFFELPKEYNRRTTDFFKKLFNDEKNKKFEKILRLLFPNVEMFCSSNINLIDNNRIEFRNESVIVRDFDRQKYKESNIKRQIYNAKFFNLYFTKTENEFVVIDNNNNNLIKLINQSSNDLEENLEKTIFENELEQRHILENLQLHIDEIKKNQLEFLISLIKIQEKLDNIRIFSGINANGRAAIVCSELIKKLSKEDMSKFKLFIESDYHDMYFIRGILYWLSSKNNEDFYQGIVDTINESFNKLLENVNLNNIDMYSKGIYCRYNVSCLMNNDEYKSKLNINRENVFKFLSDSISISIGTNGYGYSINSEFFNNFTSYEKIDNILEQIDKDKLQEKEAFIIDVYNKSKEKTEEKAIYIEKYIDLEKI